MSQKIAYVTGGMGGIGTAICQRLAKDCFKVIAGCGPNSPRKDRWLAEQKALGFDFTASEGNVGDWESTVAAFNKVKAEHGKVDVLVNNAGITIDALLIRLKNEDLDRTLNIDLKGAIYCTRAAAKQMMRERQGSIIQISSVVGESGNPGQSAYAAAKAGLIGFSKSVAQELASRHVRVNVVAPGFISTDMTGALTDAQKEAILQTIPLGFFGAPEDISSLVAFLASPMSRYITGQVIGVNGGMYM